jgi:hypothetical protein
MSTMYDDDLLVAETRRDIERSGGDWNQRITYAHLIRWSLIVVDQANSKSKALSERVEALEQQIQDLQVTAKHLEKHALIYRGPWDSDAWYPPASLVECKGVLWTALKEILPKGAPPNREGSGWTQLT